MPQKSNRTFRQGDSTSQQSGRTVSSDAGSRGTSVTGPRGPSGSIGAAGPTGAAGAAGAAGPTGAAGAGGVKGDTGAPGAPGATVRWLWVSQPVNSARLTRKGYMGIGGSLPAGVTAVSPNALQSIDSSAMTLLTLSDIYTVTFQPGTYKIKVIFKLDPDASDNTTLQAGLVGIEDTARTPNVINSVVVKSDTYKGHIESTIEIIRVIANVVSYKFFVTPTGSSNITILQGSSIFIEELSDSKAV